MQPHHKPGSVESSYLSWHSVAAVLSATIRTLRAKA